MTELLSRMAVGIWRLRMRRVEARAAQQVLSNLSYS
jgi:hypothetical protein